MCAQSPLVAQNKTHLEAAAARRGAGATLRGTPTASAQPAGQRPPTPRVVERAGLATPARRVVVCIVVKGGWVDERGHERKEERVVGERRSLAAQSAFCERASENSVRRCYGEHITRPLPPRHTSSVHMGLLGFLRRGKGAPTGGDEGEGEPWERPLDKDAVPLPPLPPLTPRPPRPSKPPVLDDDDRDVFRYVRNMTSTNVW